VRVILEAELVAAEDQVTRKLFGCRCIEVDEFALVVAEDGKKAFVDDVNEVVGHCWSVEIWVIREKELAVEIEVAWVAIWDHFVEVEFWEEGED
jgi:hypothetical protein